MKRIWNTLFLAVLFGSGVFLQPLRVLGEASIDSKENKSVRQSNSNKMDFEKEIEKLVPKSLFNQESGLIIPDSFRLGIDTYITGTVDSTIKKVVLYVNDEFIRNGFIFSGEEFEVDTGDSINNITDEVVIVGQDRKGNELTRQEVIMESSEIILTTDDYTLHDETITGIAGNQMDLVSLMVNDELITSSLVSEDDSFTLYLEAGDILELDDHVEVIGSIQGRELKRVTIPVNAVDVQAEIKAFILGEARNIEGKVTGRGKSRYVQLIVNRKRYNRAEISEDGSFSLDSGRMINNLNDDVKVAILNDKGTELARFQVTLKEPQDNTIAGIFSDENLAKYMARVFKKEVTDEVSEEELLSVTSIKYSFIPLKDSYRSLNGIERLLNLKTIDCRGGEIKDISAAMKLPNLEEIKLHGNFVSDVSCFENADLPKLKKLDLSNNNVKSVEPLKNLTTLKELSVSYSQLENIVGLEKLKNLEILSLDSGEIADISPLTGLEKLKRLYLGRNKINELYPLQGLVNLEDLNISTNNLTDISMLGTLTKLTSLSISNNNISDITVVENYSKLKELSIEKNNISDISILESENLLELDRLSAGNQEILLPNNRVKRGNLSILPQIKGMSGDTITYSSILDGGKKVEDFIVWENIRSFRNEVTVKFETSKSHMYHNYSGEIRIPINYVETDIIANTYIINMDTQVTGYIENIEEIQQVKLVVNNQDISMSNIREDGSFELESHNSIQEISNNVKIIGYNSSNEQVDDVIVQLEFSEGTLGKIGDIFVDRRLAEVVAAKIGKQVTDTVTREELMQIEELITSDNEIVSLEGIQHLKNVSTLILVRNKIEDITPLAALTNLKILELSENQIEDFSAITKNDNVEYLDLRGNKIKHIPSLKDMLTLRDLNLSENEIEHVDNYIEVPEFIRESSLGTTGSTVYVNLKNNQIKEVAFLDVLSYQVEPKDYHINFDLDSNQILDCSGGVWLLPWISASMDNQNIVVNDVIVVNGVLKFEEVIGSYVSHLDIIKDYTFSDNGILDWKEPGGPELAAIWEGLGSSGSVSYSVQINRNNNLSQNRIYSGVVTINYIN